MTNCSVKGCTTTTRHCSKTKNGITLHGFPADPVRKEMWNRIMRKQRGDPCCKKYNKYMKICSLHFTAHSFYTTKKGRIKLKDTALPSLKLKLAAKPDLKESPQETKSDAKQCPFEPKIELKIQRIDQDEDNLSDIDINDLKPVFESPNEIKLKLQIAKYEERHIKNIKTLKYLRTEIHRLKKRNLSLHNIVKDLKKKCFVNKNYESLEVTPELAEIYRMDVKRRLVKEKYPTKKPRLQFSADLQKFALTLNTISPNAYLYVRRSFNCCLPHPRTLHSWYSSINSVAETRSDSIRKSTVDSTETIEIVTDDGLGEKLTCSVDPLMITYQRHN